MPKRGVYRLSDEQILDARRSYAAGVSSRDLATRFGVCLHSMQVYLTGRRGGRPEKSLVHLSCSQKLVRGRRGEKTKDKILTKDNVVDIKRRLSDGETQTSIAEFYGVNRGTIKDICIGRNWRHVGPKLELAANRNRGVGSFNAAAVIDEADAIFIKKRLRASRPIAEIAAELGVSRSIVGGIASGRTWKHVGPALHLDRTRNRKGPHWTRCKHAKLDDVIVSYIKWHLSIGVAQTLLAKYFKVTQPAIGAIARGLTWKNVRPAKSSPHRILAPERSLPIRLRGERLKTKLKEAWTHG